VREEAKEKARDDACKKNEEERLNAGRVEMEQHSPLPLVTC